MTALKGVYGKRDDQARMTQLGHLRLIEQRAHSRWRKEPAAPWKAAEAYEECAVRMSMRPSTKAQLRRMIKERFAELRWALKDTEPLVHLASFSTHNFVLRPTRS